MRYLYSLLFYLALPYVFIRLWWRSRRLPAYRDRILERFGIYPLKLERSIWVHAVSVGEVLAAIPLIKELKIRYPLIPLLVTTMTPTGAERVKAALGHDVIHVYLPYDLPHAVERFLSAMHPLIGIIMETELWPNLLAASHARGIPLCLVNARLSAKSAKGYQRIALLTRNMLQQIDVIAAHGDADAKRFIHLGARKECVTVTGNIKFDIGIPPDLINKSKMLREQLGNDRLIWIAASTHEGEEELVLAAHQTLRHYYPEALLILVPRHPERFDVIAKLCAQSFHTARRSQQPTTMADVAVYLGDTMGELLLMYGAADVAFVGGSLVPRGGHNMLEPSALGKATLTGPHLFNFAEISELLTSAKALIKIKDTNTLATELVLLMQNATLRHEIGLQAKQVVDANRGALAKQLALIDKLLSSHGVY